MVREENAELVQLKNETRIILRVDDAKGEGAGS
jgi:hypothetical protein